MSATKTLMFVDMLYQDSLLGLDNEKEYFYNKALECERLGISGADWNCDTYSTMSSDYDLLKDENFYVVLAEVLPRVSSFAEEFNVRTDDIRCTSAWINLAHPGAFQEYHIHPESHFSMVYYVRTPERCGDTIFQSSKYYADMFPLPYRKVNYANAGTFNRPAKSGDLLIFRSNIPHMVGKNRSNEDRVSISANFCFGD